MSESSELFDIDATTTMSRATTVAPTPRGGAHRRILTDSSRSRETHLDLRIVSHHLLALANLHEGGRLNPALGVHSALDRQEARKTRRGGGAFG